MEKSIAPRQARRLLFGGNYFLGGRVCRAGASPWHRPNNEYASHPCFPPPRNGNHNLAEGKGRKKEGAGPREPCGKNAIFTHFFGGGASGQNSLQPGPAAQIPGPPLAENPPSNPPFIPTGFGNTLCATHQ